MESNLATAVPMRPGRNGGMLRIGGTNKGGPGRPRKHPRPTPETPSAGTEKPVATAEVATDSKATGEGPSKLDADRPSPNAGEPAGIIGVPKTVADADAELFGALDDLIDRFAPGATGPWFSLRDRVRATLDAMEPKEGAAALVRYVALYLTSEKLAEGFGIRDVCKTIDVLRHCVKTPLLPPPPKV